MDLRVLAVIPLRGGSKGIPRKNLRLLDGKPLMSYMISAAKSASSISRVMVSTDDEEIAQMARSLGAEVPFMRPPELAQDLTPMIAVSKHAMEFMTQQGWKPDIVVQLAAPCPFIGASRIDEAVGYIAKGLTDCAVTLKRIEHEHPYRAKELQKDGTFRSFIKHIPVEQFISRQELPTLYCTSGAIYAWSADRLGQWNGKDFCFGPNPMGVLVSDQEAVNIDRLIDFTLAEFIMAQKIEKEAVNR